MENQNAQDFVESLSTVVNEIQAKIKGLSDITMTFSSVSQFTETVLQNVEELKATFHNLNDKLEDNEQTLESLIKLNKDTLEKVTEEMTNMVTSFSSLLQSTTQQSLDYNNQTDVKLKEWQQRSEDLLTNLNLSLVEIDTKIKIELEQASQNMSKTLSPTLHKLIETLSATNIQINRSKRVMLIMSLMAGAALFASVLLTFLK